MEFYLIWAVCGLIGAAIPLCLLYRSQGLVLVDFVIAVIVGLSGPVGVLAGLLLLCLVVLQRVPWTKTIVRRRR